MVETVSAEFTDPDVTVTGDVANRHDGGEIAFDGPEAIAHDRLTLPVKLFTGAIVTVDVAELPGPTERGLSGVAETVKAACAYLATNASIVGGGVLTLLECFHSLSRPGR